jgi:pyruvate,orthophosphate dikinase
MATMKPLYIGDGSKTLHTAETAGAKAANLSRMAALDLPVPPAFVLPVDLCAAIVDRDRTAERKLSAGLEEGIAFLERATGRRFGDRRRPLLVSVRSGAARSMPGMLDTVLNVGCTPAAVNGLIRMTGHPRFAWDCRRRFLESFGDVVLGIGSGQFAARLAQLLAIESATDEHALDSEAVEHLAADFDVLVDDHDGALPEDPMEQLRAAAQAVYRSWNSPRARTYRHLEKLDDLRGTAVTVQAMVYGNRGTTSGAGVAFSRDPSTGAATPVVDVLLDAQGEDVVSGNRTPETELAIERSFPALAIQLRDTLARLECDFADVQDIEFTIEESRLWILQTRTAKRTPQAALRFAIDFVDEGLISPEEALRRLDELDLDTLYRKTLVGAGPPVARGIGASLGVAVGRAAFDPASAVRLAGDGEPVILLRPDTSTADISGFAAAAGIVTAIGGRTAHAALVARQMAKPCVVGCATLAVDPGGRRADVGNAGLAEGDWLSIDGEAGTIHLGKADVVVERPEADLDRLAQWGRTASVGT